MDLLSEEENFSAVYSYLSLNPVFYDPVCKTSSDFMFTDLCDKHYWKQVEILNQALQFCVKVFWTQSTNVESNSCFCCTLKNEILQAGKGMFELSECFLMNKVCFVQLEILEVMVGKKTLKVLKSEFSILMEHLKIGWMKIVSDLWRFLLFWHFFQGSKKMTIISCSRILNFETSSVFFYKKKTLE